MSKVNLELEKIDEINLSLLLARHATKLLWGQGFKVWSENKKIDKFLKNFVKYTRFQFLMEANEKLLSGEGIVSGISYGRTVITIDKTETGEIKLAIADPRYVNKVGMVFIQEELAVLWKKIQLDDKMYWLRQVYDTEKVVSALYDNPNNDDKPPSPGEMDQYTSSLSVMGYNEKVRPENRIREVWYHNMGICPVVQFHNLPDMTFNEYYMGYNPDNAAQGNALQKTLNNLIKQYNKAIIINKPKIIGYFPPERMKEIRETLKNPDENFAYSDSFINSTALNGNGEADIQVIQPNLQLKEYMEQIRKVVQTYFEFSGYSFNADTEKSDLTATGSIMGSQLDQETTMAKRAWRQSEIIYLLRKVLIAAGLISKDDKEQQFGFEINLNLILNSLTQAQTSQMLLQNGISSRRWEISKIHNISLEEAQDLMKEIDSDNNSDYNHQKAIENAAPVETKNIVQTNGENIAPNRSRPRTTSDNKRA